MKQIAVVSQPAAKAPATLLWCVMGLLVPRATLFGELAPFGIGLAACGGAANFPTLLCLGVGYLLAQPLHPMRYLLTVALVGAIRWVLAALPEWEHHRLIPPLLAFVCCNGTGLLVLSRSGADPYRTLLIVAEACVAAGVALFLDRGMEALHHPGETADQTALILTGAVGVMAAATVEVGGFSPGRVLAAGMVLLLARWGREVGGSIAGCVLGGAMALSAPGQASLAVALAVGGLTAGVFSRLGRWCQGGLFLLAAGVVTLGETNLKMLWYIGEIAGACLLFALLPQEWERRLSRILLRSRDLPAVEGVRRMTTLRLRVASEAMKEVAGSVETVSRRLDRHGVGDAAALMRGCRDTVCAACPLRGVCWEREEELVADLCRLIPILQEKGVAEPQNLQGQGAQCRRKEWLIAHINRGYQRLIAWEGAWRRLQELQTAVEGQFAGTGGLLEGLATRLERPDLVDVELSEQIAALCGDYGMAVVDALCTRDEGNRLTVDILARDTGAPAGNRWRRQVEQLCGRRFAPPVEARWGERVQVTLTEQPRYRVEQGVAQLCCDRERLCGDTVQVQTVGGGVLAVLSDGMGSGGRAAVDSAMAAGITTRLWTAGFTPDAVLQTVNAALLVKSREESLATLDVVTVDTHTGRLDSYKAGAATTLLYSGGRVSRIDRPGLPVGILPVIHFEHSHDTLSHGDVLLLVSDGALAGGVAVVEELLRQHAADGSMTALAQAVCAVARGAEEDHGDDITAVALRVTRDGADFS